jgi:hypothetical protein
MEPAMSLIIVLYFWIALSIAVGKFADIRRGRDSTVWFLLALIGSPLVAFVFCAILEPEPRNTASQPPSNHPSFDDLPPAEQARLRRQFGDDLSRSRGPVERALRPDLPDDFGPDLSRRDY